MQRFTEKIVSMMKSEGLFEWQGGPIILSQVRKSLLQPSSRLGHLFCLSVLSQLTSLASSSRKQGRDRQTKFLTLILGFACVFSRLQIENEYGPLEYNGGAAARSYANWAAKMAVGLNTGVPWLMCKEDDAPDPVVRSSLSLSR